MSFHVISLVLPKMSCGAVFWLLAMRYIHLRSPRDLTVIWRPHFTFYSRIWPVKGNRSPVRLILHWNIMFLPKETSGKRQNRASGQQPRWRSGNDCSTVVNEFHLPVQWLCNYSFCSKSDKPAPGDYIPLVECQSIHWGTLSGKSHSGTLFTEWSARVQLNPPRWASFIEWSYVHYCVEFCLNDCRTRNMILCGLRLPFGVHKCLLDYQHHFPRPYP